MELRAKLYVWLNTAKKWNTEEQRVFAMTDDAIGSAYFAGKAQAYRLLEQFLEENKEL